MAETVEEYRRRAAAAELARRRDQARLSYDEKLVIVRRLRRVAAALRGAEPGSGTLIPFVPPGMVACRAGRDDNERGLLPAEEKGNSPSPVPGEGQG